MGEHQLARAVFLDRDGVLNATVARAGAGGPPWRLDDLRLLPGVEEACGRLRAAGWLLIVVTNQPDVARGALSPTAVQSLHERLRQWLPLHDILVCMHDDADQCVCRKPKPGMLLEAASRYGIVLPRSWMVGDRCKDVDAGAAAGVRTVLIQPPGALPAACQADWVAASLLAAVARINSEVSGNVSERV